ncbi:glycerate kinase II [Salmonella enterica subsp. enterica serovar Choleraesuis str. 0006]|nr:glycerate kinase II [Salmonella enterica subsp. enterica serovar Choleraesuis str. 0006]
MKIVIAPDSFKESLSADKCCQAIKAGFSTVFPDARYVCLPIADGGEGTVDAMVAATGGKRVSVDVSGPMGEKVNGFYGLTGDGKTAIIEMAAASGLMLVAPEARNPLLASSFGTGELIRHALDAGIRHIILGIGGSATVDGGMGVAQALGVRFWTRRERRLAPEGAIYRAWRALTCRGAIREFQSVVLRSPVMLITRWWGHAVRRRYSVRRKGRRLKWLRRWKMDYVIMPVFYMP